MDLRSTTHRGCWLQLTVVAAVASLSASRGDDSTVVTSLEAEFSTFEPVTDGDCSHRPYPVVSKHWIASPIL